ncbi:hypothetical protein [Apibacter sp. HY039]|uniref:hypothetical protein n=1 Tax=Apibacter sp. HY039 TaxID=2501476 RepID=UPI0013E2D6C1|nr:hypothetical protein [Apibacter sp. HY039]
MSFSEYNRTEGTLMQRTDKKGNYMGEGPFVTTRLDYALKALYDFGSSCKYNLIVEYTVRPGSKVLLNMISIPYGPGVTVGHSQRLGLTIKK